MQQGSGFILVLAGLLLLWIVVSGKYDLMETFFRQLFELPLPQAAVDTGKYGTTSGSGNPVLDKLLERAGVDASYNVYGSNRAGVGVDYNVGAMK